MSLPRNWNRKNEGSIREPSPGSSFQTTKENPDEKDLTLHRRCKARRPHRGAVAAAASTELLAQGTSPWLQAIDVLQQAFTGPIARGLSLIAIVVGGLMFAFGEGGSKKALAGIVFGLGMAMGAANFLAWLF